MKTIFSPSQPLLYSLIQVLIRVLSTTVLISSCAEKSIHPVVALPVISAHNNYQVEEWLIAGPFKTNIDSLSRLANSSSESILKLDSIFNRNRMLSENSSHQVENYKPSLEFIDFSEVSTLKAHDTYFYSSVLLKTKRKQMVTILSGNRRGMEIWLNDKKVLHSIIKEKYDNYSQYVNYTNVILDKGYNTLLIRHYFSPADEEWTSICHLANPEYSTDYYFRKSNNDLIKTNFVSKGNPLVLTNRLYSGDTKVRVEICEPDSGIIQTQDILASRYFNVTLPDVKDGLYYCSVRLPDFTLREPFYLGDANRIGETYLDSINSLKKRFPEEAIHLEALRLRLIHLLKFKAVEGQVTSYFSLDTSEDGKNWVQLFTGESKATNVNDFKILSQHKIRYIRFTGHMTSANSYNNIAELEIEGSSGIEITPHKIKASGHYGKDNPSNISDKDYNTAWSQEGEGKWIEVDLGSISDVAEIRLAFRKSILDPEIEVRLWQRKIVVLLSEIESLLIRSRNEKELFKLMPGRHLRGYISDIDQDTLHYMVQVPSGIRSGTPLPVVLFPPINMGTRSPFLVSMLAADILKDDKINIEIERHNMIAVVFSANNYESELMPGFCTELNSILKDVATDFPIDTTSIYLYGICASSAKSLQYAAWFPHKIAAISNVSAAFKYDNYTNVANLFNIPLLFIHSKEDTHSPYPPLKLFTEVADIQNIEPETKIFPSASHYFYANAFVNLSFDYFKGKSINYSPAHIKYSTKQLKYNQAYWIRLNQINYDGSPVIEANIKDNLIEIETTDVYSFSLLIDSIPVDHSKPLKVRHNKETIYRGTPENNVLTFDLEDKSVNSFTIIKTSTTEGPINHFFAQKFLIIQGTTGDTTEKLNSHITAEEIRADWKSYYYNDITSSYDTSLTEADIKETNLLLLGNDKTNGIIKEIIDSLPVKFSNDGFRFRNTEYDTSHSIFLIYPNPLNPDKYILLAGGAYSDVVKWKVKSSLFTDKNDFVVISSDGAIVASGNFNRFWQ